MNYAKLSEVAIVGGASCVKGIQGWSSPAPLSPLPMAESRLISALANSQSDGCRGGWIGGWAGPLGDRWIVLEGLAGKDKYAFYYPLFMEVTDREIWADLCSSPGRNIVSKQKSSEELPFQHSGGGYAGFCRLLCVMKSGVCVCLCQLI